MFASCLVMAQESPANMSIELRTGEKILITKISKVEPDGVTVWTDAGPKKISVAKLALVELTRFSLSEEAAQAHAVATTKQASTQAALQQETQPPASARPPVPPAAKFITADDVKIMWVKKLPQPRKLDANYSKIVQSYREFIGEIRAGRRDLDAQETAATYNKAQAIEVGNNELVSTFEAELVRISEAKTAEEALAAQQKQSRRDRVEFMMLNSQLDSIDRNIRAIRRGW